MVELKSAEVGRKARFSWLQMGPTPSAGGPGGRKGDACLVSGVAEPGPGGRSTTTGQCAKDWEG